MNHQSNLKLDVGLRKQFDKQLFEIYDRFAREKTTQYLESIGYDVVPHPNQYAQDLIAYKDHDAWFVECEVKNAWSGKNFPYPSVQLPERKKKFFDHRTQFFIWNKQGEHAMTFWSTDILKLEPVEVYNRFISSGEYFYQIPMDMITKVNVT